LDRNSFKEVNLILFADMEEEIMKEPPLRRASKCSDRSSNCMFNSLKRKGFQTHDSEQNIHVPL